ncbi:MAG: YebC/PmpR family DNA-binding transcriptional regulator [Pelagibacterales bacterium]|jgi:YebC/PmpR family DNA-binding regulatory protein|nr:YebC/PmpR family DNA-binding transcriptional regulator [Pelagibacterales bacterium]MBL6861609.1 YebC/PmpR family DNA-binding transcriptional regulator [Pelagibacterales bacterium]|tara:strand:- start:210 stop:953 length:744 start_codon:yes stop_codon:yes gene_type:complete
MAGHSKFKNIQFRKGAQDKKRAVLFSKLSKEITVAAKSGMPDPDQNARLRSAIQVAKAASFPRENIERAIKKSSDKSMGMFDEIRYEGFGPAGTSIIVEALTDNRNRSAADIRAIFQKNGGNFAESGSVSHQFTRYGFLKYPTSICNQDEFFSSAIESGAEDCLFEDDGFEALCSPDNLAAFYSSLENIFKEPESSGFLWKPSNLIDVTGEKVKILFNLLDELDDNEDVQAVFSNYDVSEEDISSLA